MIRSALAGAIELLAVAGSALAQATAPAVQPAQTAPAGAGELKRITVTGYIIPRIGEGTQPVINLSRDFISRQGDLTVAEVLNRLPQNTQSFTPLVFPGSTFTPGASEVNLYGIGTNSTLVLIDGKRQTIFPFPQNGFQSFVDLNSIPLAAVERIEILKDGASSIYGSDAIAGVVNVILKDEYNGSDIVGYWGISQRGDDEVYNVQATTGISHRINDNSKFSMVATFDYYENSPIDADNRAFSNNINHSIRGPDLVDLRSFSPPAGNFVGRTSGNLFSVVPGSNGNPAQLVNFGPVANAPAGAGNFYNTVPGSQLLPRETRFGTYEKITYQPFQFLQLYDEFSYQHNEEKASTIASPVSASDSVTTPATNPFNPTGEDLVTRLRLLGLGQEKTDTTIEDVRNVVGIRLFNLPKNWFVDASFLYAESDGEIFESNFITKTGFKEALAGTLPGFEGVFYNPFVDQNTLTPQNQAILNALRINPDDHARTGLVQWLVTTGGELFDLPAGAVTLGLGAEYRSNEYIDYKDSNSRFGNVLAGGGSGNASGKDYVKAMYGQVTIPILGGQCSWLGARLLEFVASERYDDYSSFGEAWKPKFSIRYKPFDDLTLRGSYSEGFRAPSVTELFGFTLASFNTFTDPRVPPPPNGSSYEMELLTSGNPHLEPETSYSYYAGAVWTPGSVDPEQSWWGWANGFTAYVDWVEISKHNVIDVIPAQFIINNPQLFPGFVTRDSFGNIVSIVDPLENLGAIRVDALDFGDSYITKECDWGKLDLTFDATWYYHVSEQVTPGGQVINATSSLASTLPVTPDFKATASLFYSKTLFGVDTFRTGLTLNYLDFEHDVNDFQGLGQTLAQLGLPQTHTVGSWTTLDWQISYEFGRPEEITPETPKPGYDKEGKRIPGEQAISPKPDAATAGLIRWLAGTTFTFGINNIFDTRPPFSDQLQGYDTLSANPIMRFFYVQLEKKF